MIKYDQESTAGRVQRARIEACVNMCKASTSLTPGLFLRPQEERLCQSLGHARGRDLGLRPRVTGISLQSCI